MLNASSSGNSGLQIVTEVRQWLCQTLEYCLPKFIRLSLNIDYEIELDMPLCRTCPYSMLFWFAFSLIWTE